MRQENSISIIVPALNEEDHLEQAVRTILTAVEAQFDDYEILIFNDGSSDRTGQIADGLATKYPQVQAFHHPTPRCLGGVMRAGYAKAKMQYAMWVDGKGATKGEALDAIFERRGQADLIIGYTANMRERSWSRRVVSHAFCKLLNILFGLGLRQYTHLVLAETDLFKVFPIRTNSYAYHAELIIKLLKAGAGHIHLGVDDNFDFEGRRTRAFRWQNLSGVAMFLAGTLWDVYFLRLPKRFGGHFQLDRTSHFVAGKTPGSNPKQKEIGVSTAIADW